MNINAHIYLNYLGNLSQLQLEKVVNDYELLFLHGSEAETPTLHHHFVKFCRRYDDATVHDFGTWASLVLVRRMHANNKEIRVLLECLSQEIAELKASGGYTA